MQRIDILEPEFFRLIEKRYETRDTFTIELAPLEEKTLDFMPGQFNMLYAFGVGEVPVSISSNSSRTDCYGHTVKIVGNVTKALDRIAVGDLVGVRGPFGSSWPVEECKGRDVVVIAGGIGLAPMRPLIYSLLDNRKEFGNVALLYGAREPKEIVFADELREWNQAFDDQVYLTVDYANEKWSGNVGVVTRLLSRIPFSLERSVALLCGPEIMLRFAVNELKNRHVEDRDIYLAMERNMKCAIGHCGRCQYVSNFICKDGSVLSYEKVKPFFAKKEI